MKRKVLIIFISVIGLLFVLVAFYGTANPGSSQDHEDCHSTGGYAISTDVNTTNSATPSETITIEITASGSNLFVQAPSPTRQNAALQITPTTDKILDGDPEDDDTNADAMVVIFNITVPEDDGFYYFFVLAGDNAVSQPTFAYIEIGFSVGGVSAPKPDPIAEIFSAIFNHLGFYLGMPALVLLSLGTVLVLVNENKFVKLHGILAGASWILTTINVTVAFIKIEPQDWLTGYELIYHIPHIILGAIGLVTGFISMLFGIAAERTPARIWGYITLICWWAAFFTGYLLKPNLFIL
jgi:hypothetical protein